MAEVPGGDETEDERRVPCGREVDADGDEENALDARRWA